MRKLGENPVYNSRILKMLLSSRVRCCWCALLLLSHLSFATDWQRPAAQLAGKISAITGPGVIALDISNRCSISPAEVEQIRHLLVSELATSGVRVWQPDQAAAVARITLSENLASYLWVAEVQQGTAEKAVAMVSFDRPPSTAAAPGSSLLILRAAPLMSQTEPILDVALLEGSPRRALLLSNTNLVIYEFRDGHWLAGQSMTIPHTAPFPRDLRGRIIPRKDRLLDAYLPGVVCHGAESGTLSLNCSETDDPWPLSTPELNLAGFFTPARNYFTGVLSPGVGKQKSGPPFYSAATVLKGNYVLWVMAGTDGQVHMLDGINHQLAAKIHWGSEISSIRAACRPDAFVLATSPGEKAESIQVFDFPDREPVAVSQPLPLKGPITALWPQQNGESVTAVYRNSETGNYEALQLTLACGE